MIRGDRAKKRALNTAGIIIDELFVSSIVIELWKYVGTTDMQINMTALNTTARIWCQFVEHKRVVRMHVLTISLHPIKVLKLYILF